MNDETRRDVEPADSTGQLTYAGQTAASVTLACVIVGIPFLFADDRVVVALTVTTAVFVAGCALLINPRTRAWGGVVVAVAVPFYLVTGLM
ncbi:hypothetical protein IA539_07855 [Gordonia sp. zg691]|uniref:Uncharacterized protein n=1 Tax=Gordonia jinghuaiqii TaxID=2758710 RepID=A0A7D7R1H6_9ACTN|nr:hypothetical protein [Gordonia jinghuaiqii]MBD0861128.1 hypothetical protein [Gordonia jinghuaiqii]MCR5979712.1 hypothetical protein [Gordonia jinghuaiqii]QMT00887.1 hypothetical protein H1R19_18740 [Gordonia jinghuaiqii]